MNEPIKPDYESFLICFHKDHYDIYHNGLPIGVLHKKDDIMFTFQIHKNKLPNGDMIPIKFPKELIQRVEETVHTLNYQH